MQIAFNESVPRLDATGHPCQSWEDDRFQILWTGLIFGWNERVGVPTVRRLAQELVSQSLGRLCRELHGTFGLFVLDRSAQAAYSITDNAGLFHLFYDQQRVSTDIFDLAEGSGKYCPLDHLIELLAIDTPHAQRTMVSGVRRLRGDEILSICRTKASLPSQQLAAITSKQLDYAPPTSSALIDYVGRVASAFQGKKISLDLTSGTDSRMLASLLTQAGMEFEVAVSGRHGIPDVEIPKRIARLLGKELHVLDHDVSHIGADLTSLLRHTGGQLDMLRQHRLFQFQREREERGVEISIGGAGGELYKDFWWLHDLPFLPSSRVHFDRLYDVRITPQPLPKSLLTPTALASFEGLRSRVLEEFEQYRATTNTASYDNVYFFWRTPALAGPSLSMYAKHSVSSLTPLMDRELFEFARRLPVTTRLFHGFHRRIVSRYTPQIASIATEEGLTLRQQPWARVQDGLAYGYSFARRRIRKVGQRYVGTNWFQISPNNPLLIDTARNLPQFALALQTLQAAGVVAESATIANIPPKFVGRFITAGLFVQSTHLPVS